MPVAEHERMSRLPEVSSVYRNGMAEPVGALHSVLYPIRVLKRFSAR